MSDIVIHRTHGLSAPNARKAADKIAAELEEEFDLDCEWDDDDVLHFNRHGVSGHLSLSKHAVDIHVRLGFLLVAMRPHIESEIHRYCDENFGRELKPLI